MSTWHAQGIGELSAALGGDADHGLSASAAAKRLAQDGPNQLPAAMPVSAWRLLTEQFKSLIVWVLVGAALVSGLLHEIVDAIAIGRRESVGLTG